MKGTISRGEIFIIWPTTVDDEVKIEEYVEKQRSMWREKERLAYLVVEVGRPVLMSFTWWGV